MESLTIEKLRKKYSFLLDRTDDPSETKELVNVISQIARQAVRQKLPYLLLEAKLGRMKFREIQRVVNEIKRIRRNTCFWNSTNYYSPKGLPIKEMMSKPLYSIYVENDLVNAYSSLSATNFSSLDVPWIDYLDSAKCCLEEIRNNNMTKVK